MTALRYKTAKMTWIYEENWRKMDLAGVIIIAGIGAALVEWIGAVRHAFSDEPGSGRRVARSSLIFMAIVFVTMLSTYLIENFPVQPS